MSADEYGRPGGFRLLPWLLGIILLVVAVPTAFLFSWVWDLVGSTPETVLASNWGVRLPPRSSVIEHHEEASFHGDGYRVTVVTVEPPVEDGVGIFDISNMSSEPLTIEQSGLVVAAAKTLRPTNHLDMSTPGLRTAESAQGDGSVLLCVFDPSANRFFIYEELL